MGPDPDLDTGRGDEDAGGNALTAPTENTVEGWRNFFRYSDKPLECMAVLDNEKIQYYHWETPLFEHSVDENFNFAEVFQYVNLVGFNMEWNSLSVELCFNDRDGSQNDIVGHENHAHFFRSLGNILSNYNQNQDR